MVPAPAPPAPGAHLRYRSASGDHGKTAKSGQAPSRLSRFPDSPCTRYQPSEEPCRRHTSLRAAARTEEGWAPPGAGWSSAAAGLRAGRQLQPPPAPTEPRQGSGSAPGTGPAGATAVPEQRRPPRAGAAPGAWPERRQPGRGRVPEPPCPAVPGGAQRAGGRAEVLLGGRGGEGAVPCCRHRGAERSCCICILILPCPPSARPRRLPPPRGREGSGLCPRWRRAPKWLRTAFSPARCRPAINPGAGGSAALGCCRAAGRRRSSAPSPRRRPPAGATGAAAAGAQVSAGAGGRGGRNGTVRGS